MKKVLPLIALLLYGLGSHSQTVLSRHYLNLKKPQSSQQIITTATPDERFVYVFASDKSEVHIQKYNSAVFFIDSLVLNRPESKYQMSGYGFSDDNTPYLYWTSEDFKSVRSMRCSASANAADNFSYEFTFQNETFLNAFSENNNFYLLTAVKNEGKDDKNDHLKMYVFKDGQLSTQLLDFSNFPFADTSNTPQRLFDLIKNNTFEYIASKSLNSLLNTVSKNKMYISGHTMTLTLDHNITYTHVFQVDLNTWAITEKKIPQPTLSKGTGITNSFYSDGKLYQLKISESEINISSKDLQTETLLNSHNATKDGDITFRNSPLFIQTGDQKPRQLKNTKQYLQKLATSDIGINVYQTPFENLITIGGLRDVASTSDIVMGVTLGVGLMLSGGSDYSALDLFERDRIQSVFVEGLFDDQFQHLDYEQNRLASDYLFTFLDQNEDIISDNVFRFKDYFIMGSYDSKAKEYIMRKFADD